MMENKFEKATVAVGFKILGIKQNLTYVLGARLRSENAALFSIAFKCSCIQKFIV
jgi:hypothetical protein